jgi:hypothetical protein
LDQLFAAESTGNVSAAEKHSMGMRHSTVLLLFALGCSKQSAEVTDSAQALPSPVSVQRPHLKTSPDASAVPPDQIWFLPAQCGLESFRHVCGARGDYRYPEICVAGCAMFDYDNDGDPDVYFVQSGKWPDDPAYVPMPSRLFRNDGDRFTDVTEASGTGSTGYGFGCCAGDYDNDGWLDLFVTNYGAQCVLYRNKGDGTFENVTERAGSLST